MGVGVERWRGNGSRTSNSDTEIEHANEFLVL